MADELLELLQGMQAERLKHRDRLLRWKANGGHLENYPEHETIDDFIAREDGAVQNLSLAIARLTAQRGG